MFQTIKSLKLKTIVLVLIELLLVAGFFTLWFYDIWSLRSVISVTIMCVCLVVFIFINAMTGLETYQQYF